MLSTDFLVPLEAHSTWRGTGPHHRAVLTTLIPARLSCYFKVKMKSGELSAGTALAAAVTMPQTEGWASPSTEP